MSAHDVESVTIDGGPASAGGTGRGFNGGQDRPGEVRNAARGGAMSGWGLFPSGMPPRAALWTTGGSPGPTRTLPARLV
jgi:hypothetical protein